MWSFAAQRTVAIRQFSQQEHDCPLDITCYINVVGGMTIDQLLSVDQPSSDIEQAAAATAAATIAVDSGECQI